MESTVVGPKSRPAGWDIRHSFLKSSHVFAGRLIKAFEQDPSREIITVGSFPYNAFCFRNPTHLAQVFSDKAVGNRKEMNLLPKIFYLTKAGSYSRAGVDDWTEYKRQTNFKLNHAALGNTLYHLNAALDDAISKWRTAGSVSVKDVMGMLITDICYRVFLSHELAEETDDIERITSKLVAQFASPTPVWLPLPQNIVFKRNAGILQRKIENIISTRVAGPVTTANGGDIISQLLRRDSKALALTAMRDEIMAIILGGHTMAVALTWCFIELLRHAELLESLRSAITDEAVNNLNLIDEVPMLDQFVKEVLRLYPPGWTIPRFTDKEIIIGDILIPPKSLIFPLIYFAQRHPEYWPDPNRFSMARFEPSTRIHHFAYFPFGAGYRACPGRVIAPLIIKFVLARMIKELRMEAVDDWRTTGKYFGFELVPDRQIRMRIACKN